MGNGKTMSLDEFKDILTSSNEARDKIVGRTDLIDLDNGVMRIYYEHIDKYLEKYVCKTPEELEDTLYYNYGIYCEIIY